MNNKSKIALFFISILLLLGFYIYISTDDYAYENLNEVKAGVSISSEDLVSLFTENEKLANSKYRGKVIEVEGVIKEISFLNDRNTVLLHSKTRGSSVLCDMQANQIEAVKKLRKGQQVKLKGICKGFLKDAIVLHCILTNTQTNE